MANSAKVHGKRRKGRSLHRERGSSSPGHPLYKDSRWRGANGLRKLHLSKQPFCVECRKEGKPIAECIPAVAIVDHIRPHRGRPELFFDESNLQTMCKSHHSMKTLHDMGGFG